MQAACAPTPTARCTFASVDDRVGWNRSRSLLLVVVVLALAGGIGYGLGRLFGAAGWVAGGVALGVAALIALWSYFFGDRAVLRASRAIPASEQDLPQVHNLLDGLSQQARIPKPALYLIPESAPNALATGRNPRRAKVGVTTGLLETLNRVELEGVLAHELSHVAERDTLVGTLVATLVGSIVLLFGWVRSALSWGAAQARAGGTLISILAWVVLSVGAVLSLFLPFVAQLMRMWVSRRREFLADAHGARLTRYPPGLANALRKIAGAPNQMAGANNATAHLWLSQPSRTPGFGYTFVERLFSTHPPLEERIKALEEM
jgi:heat shock protein HtpX